MKDNISITVPMDKNALLSAATMLASVANGLDNSVNYTEFTESVTDAISNAVGVPADELKKPVETVTEQVSITETPASTATVPPEPAPPSPDEAPNAAPPPPVAPSQIYNVDLDAVASTVAVEVDADGLPWDDRIHASSRATLAKTKQWKKKRGVDPAIVATVEAELRAVSGAPVSDSTPAEQAFQTTPPLVATPPPAVETATAPPTGHTFATLLQAINAKGLMGSPELTAALASVGVESIALLGPKPELIPTVALVLGV